VVDQPREQTNGEGRPGRRNAAGENRQLHGVSTSTERSSELASPDFAVIYRANVAAVMGFFARRGVDPQTVADLTSETFAEAIASLGTFDPAKGAPRPWLYAIARAVYARHRERATRHEHTVSQLSRQVELDESDIEDLEARIDAERQSREVLSRCAELPELERHAIELVDLDGLRPKEAAASLGISAGVLRVRLFRARTKLRKDMQ
jgi:RNA polymerase sigma factor (sigma-70 family)